MANQEKINEAARKELADERNKFGFKPVLSDEDDEDDLDRGNIEDDEDADDEDGEDDTEDTTEEKEDSKDDDKGDDDDDSDDSEDDSDEDEDEDEEEEDDDSEKDLVNPKKVKIFGKYNKVRKELKEERKRTAELLAEKAELEAKLPDDFEKELDKFTAELGVKDPDSLKKIVEFLKTFGIDKNATKLQKQIDDLKGELQAAKQSKPVNDEFPGEWKSFEKSVFEKEFPNATEEQKKIAFKKMEVLAKTPGTGGKVYTDKDTGKKVLDPYPLSYIFWEHRKEFEGVVTKKSVRSMESSRTAGIHSKENAESTDLEKPLPKNAPGDAISKMDKKYRNIENKQSGGLRAVENQDI